jgi:polygalacturonase
MTKLLAALGLIIAAWPAAAADKPVVDPAPPGLVADGKTLNTAALQQAIDACSAAGGGTVRLGAGRYLTGTLQLRSGVTLRLDADATLLGSPDAADYRNLDPFTDGSGNPMGYALIVAVDAERVGLVGEGTVDGQGPQLKARQNPFIVRPFLVRWVRCRDVTVRGIHLANPGAWTLNFSRTKQAVVEDVTIRSREEHLTNNDGINIDSSEDIRVRHCDVVSGDDALVIKSTSPTPCRSITASDCALSTRTNAIKLGTESLGGFEHITISHCRITQTEMSGIALYTVDGGNLQDVTISDVSMDGVAVPISIRLGSRLKTFRAGDRPKPTGRLRDVTIRNVSARNVGLIGILVNGVPGHPVEAVTLTNVALELPGGGTAAAAQISVPEKEAAYPEYNMFGKVLPAYAVYLRHVRGLKLENVRVRALRPDGRPPAVLLDVADLEGGVGALPGT